MILRFAGGRPMPLSDSWATSPCTSAMSSSPFSSSGTFSVLPLVFRGSSARSGSCSLTVATIASPYTGKPPPGVAVPSVSTTRSAAPAAPATPVRSRARSTRRTLRPPRRERIVECGRHGGYRNTAANSAGDRAVMLESSHPKAEMFIEVDVAPTPPPAPLPQCRFVFPDPRRADPEGLLAEGGDLEPSTLIAAYRAGIFPWPYEDHDLLWWSPDPRAVVPLDALH